MYPGSFNPPTRAHLEIAAEARQRHDLDRVDLAVSRVALGKDAVETPTLADRVRVLLEEAAAHDWLGVVVTEDRLIVDIARGYHVVVMGADKWSQVCDDGWYESTAERDRALAELPEVAIAPRPPHQVPAEHLLDVDPALGVISSTEARRGRRDLMSPAAARFDEQTGAWTDPDRYRRWLGECR